jgi:glucan phosphoethanolaminetransferase (alkaline phosphatase superfamily)
MRTRWTTYCSVDVLGAMRIAPLLAMALWASRDQPVRLVVTILLTGALEAYLLASITRTWRLFFLAGFPVFLLGASFAIYTVLYGTPPARSLAFILLTTSPEEVIGFVGISQAKTPVLVFITVVGLYLYLAWKLPRTLPIADKSPVVRRSVLAFLLLAAAYAGSNPGELIDGVSYSPTTGAVMFLSGALPSARDALQGSQVVKVPYHAHRTGDEEVHILVLGESARRDSWSAYGYERPTTPYLSRLKDEAIFLQNAIADANLTTWSVPILLTGMTPEAFSTTPIRGNILDLAKEAGYYTAWLLNQDITISNSVGIAADRLVYPADFKANVLDRHTLDEALLPGYVREIGRAGGSRFIGIHMMGSHWEYYRRYPPSFRRFGSGDGLSMISIFSTGEKVETSVVDTYDNTVLYTDWFLQQVIETARQLTVPVTVTFFPDHGEDLQKLDGKSGHGAPEYTQHAFEIPAFVWVNGAYRKAHPEKVSALQHNSSREIRSHNLFSTLADLMGITWPGAVPAHSFASAQFVPDTATKFAAGGVLVTGR